MVDQCDLCGSANLSVAYKVPTTKRGLTVYICEDCSLLQSLPRIDYVEKRDNATMLGGAGWGNIRYGKGFRTKHALDLLRQHDLISSVGTLLDIGSNRGSFVKAFLDENPKANVWAVEPDERVVSDYEGLDQVRLIQERIEHVDLPGGKFDLIYSSHTLEHVRSGRACLEQSFEALADNGIMFLEVPNTDILNFENQVEEFFMDKHLYHYSAKTLIELLNVTGFEVLFGPDPQDETYLTLILRKASPRQPNVAALKNEVGVARKQLSHYEEVFIANLERLKKGSRWIEELSRDKRIAIWGGGRIFSNLLEYGELDASCLVGVIDKNLSNYIQAVQGCKLLKPEAIQDMKPDVLVIASRLFFDEIKAEAEELVPGLEYVSLDDILNQSAGTQ
ncbi:MULTISPECIES: class I SAM-dependent methyltransferase [Pseudomonadati]|uniref:class I SAM-dependent methyltransferase n=1 Tax=Pseudomonadati TaxID=3379134 RepID=UPI003AA9CF34